VALGRLAAFVGGLGVAVTTAYGFAVGSTRLEEDDCMRVSICLIGVCLGALLSLSASQAQEESLVIEDGRKVSIEYTLTLDDGSKADSNVGGEPLVYQQGAQQILPALEQELAGLEVNDTKEVSLPPERGYGLANPELRQEVDAELIPEEARTEGTTLVSQDQAGNRRIVRVDKVIEDRIVLDLNHPLAGETLHFEVKVLGIE
jgi:FKBP-type peptidyl-prolyl cis-trans isomerase 2